LPITICVLFDEDDKMKKIDNGFDANMLYRPKFNKGQDANKLSPTRSHQMANTDSIALTNRNQLGTTLIFQSVSMQFSSMSRSFNSGMTESEEVKENDSTIFDFEKVAETVMHFISGSINAAKGRGASDEELNEMFGQARSGFNLGFDQALGELEELSLLDDELTEGIEKSRSLIAQGIDDLEQSYFPSALANDKAASNDHTNQKNKITNEQSSKVGEVNYNSDLYASSSRSSDLTIITADGDKVSISFSDTQRSSQNESYARGDNKETYQFASGNYREVSFSYHIEGNIDEGEQKAIESLINEVNVLQKDFFNGDIEKAYEHALTLGFDNEQIANFSIDLQQSQITKVSQAYSEIAGFDDKHSPKDNNELRPLLDFVEQFKLLQDKAAEILSKQDEQFTQLLDAVFLAEFGDNEAKQERFDKFIEKFKS